MRDRWAALWLAAAILLFHWRVLFHPGFALPWDMRSYHLPLAAALADSIGEGEFPYWEPYSYCGRPLAANPQAAVFYPTVALAAAFGRQGLLDRLEWNVILHIWLGGWFAYLLAKRRGLQPEAALCTGLIYSLGGFFASQVQHMGSVMAAAWLPLAWEGALYRSRARLTAACFFAILAGFTPMTMVVLGSALCMNARGIAAVASALALAAFQLGPAFDLMQQSVARFRTDWIGAGGGLPWQSLVSLLAPDWYGIFNLETYRQPLEPTHLYVFCGWVGLGLAVWGSRRERRLAVLAGAFAIAMLGESTPIGTIVFRLLPELVQASFYWYPFLAAFTLCVALLAGSAVRSHGVIWALAATVELTLVGSGRPMNTQSLVREPALSAADVRTVRQVAGDGRIDTIDDAALAWSIEAPFTRLASANGYDPLALSGLIDLRMTMARGHRWGSYYPVETPRADALAALGVSVLIKREPARAYDGLRQASETIPGHVLYRVANPVPRVHTARRVGPAAPPNFDAASEAVVEGLGYLSYGPATLENVVFSRNEVRARVSSAGGTFLVVSDALTPDWQSFIDDKATRLYRANHAMRGVAVPPGTHEVRMAIDRWHFWRWSLISLAAASVLAFLNRKKSGHGPLPWPRVIESPMIC